VRASDRSRGRGGRKKSPVRGSSFYCRLRSRRRDNDTISLPLMSGCSTMGNFSLVLLCLLVGLSQAIVLRAVAQGPAAPGAGHGSLIGKHVAAGLTCGKCHTEGTAKAPEMVTCLSCHGRTYANLAAQTDKDQPNPHASHRGEVPCGECHHVHRASVILCNQCHTYDMTAP